MTPEMERKWALAKAGILRTQAAFMTIVLARAKTFEELQAAVKDNIEDLETMAAEFSKEPPRNRIGEN